MAECSQIELTGRVTKPSQSHVTVRLHLFRVSDPKLSKFDRNLIYLHFYILLYYLYIKFTILPLTLWIYKIGIFLYIKYV